MDYNNYTKKHLLERIEELEILNRELLKEKEQEARLDYAWTGNLGHWYWNIKTRIQTIFKQPQATIAERIRKAVENRFLGNLKITISGGVKEFNGESIKELINSADKNLYDVFGM